MSSSLHGASATALAATRSPLDKLVRQTSKRAARGAREPQNLPRVVVNDDDGLGGRMDDESPADSYYSAQSQSTVTGIHQQDSPGTPLLHTRFTGSTFARYSDMSDASSYAAALPLDDDASTHRPFSQLAGQLGSSRPQHDSRSLDSPTIPPSPTPSSPTALSLDEREERDRSVGLRAPQDSSYGQRYSDVDPFAFREHESTHRPPAQQQQQYPSPVAIQAPPSPRQQHPSAAPASDRSSQYRVEAPRSDDGHRRNFSRPVRRAPDQEHQQPPPQQQRNQYPAATTPEYPQQQQQQVNPYLRQQPSPTPPARQPSPTPPPRDPRRGFAPALAPQRDPYGSAAPRDPNAHRADPYGATPYHQQRLPPDSRQGYNAPGEQQRQQYGYQQDEHDAYSYGRQDERSPSPDIGLSYDAPSSEGHDATPRPSIDSEVRPISQVRPPPQQLNVAAANRQSNYEYDDDSSPVVVSPLTPANALNNNARAAPAPGPGPQRGGGGPGTAPQTPGSAGGFTFPPRSPQPAGSQQPSTAPSSAQSPPSSSAAEQFAQMSSPASATTTAISSPGGSSGRPAEYEYGSPSKQPNAPWGGGMLTRTAPPMMGGIDIDSPGGISPGGTSPGGYGDEGWDRGMRQHQQQSPSQQQQQHNPYIRQQTPEAGYNPYMRANPSPSPGQRGPSPSAGQRGPSPIPPRGQSPLPPGQQFRGPSPLPPGAAPPHPPEAQLHHDSPQQQLQHSPVGMPPPQLSVNDEDDHQRFPHAPPPIPSEPLRRENPPAGRESYYSTASQYFPPPASSQHGHGGQNLHVQLSGAPPSPLLRPGSSNSVYSNYSYYNIPSPTGSGSSSGTPTNEHFPGRTTPTDGNGHLMVPGSRGPSSQGQQGRPAPNPSSQQQQGGYGQPRTAPLPPDGPRNRMGHGRDMSDGTALRVTRDVLGATERGYGAVPAETSVPRMSEDTMMRDGGGGGEKEKKGWFGRRHKDVPERERKISGVSSKSYGGRTSPTGSSFSATHHATLPNPNPNELHADTPQDFLTLGIAAHEAMKLQESAYCFEQAACLKGGCAVGMLMWGLALRHAWGVKKDEREGFRWLRRAAGRAVEGLEAAYDGKTHAGPGPGGKQAKGELEGVKTELVLAIYEVGQCFFHGWGVATDKKMAISYYQVAARLGDMDAQQALAFCYANGRGTKKDLTEAAKWYRAAAAQGASTVGLAWIYKAKYGAEQDVNGGPALR